MYCSERSCGAAILSQGWGVLQEFGTLGRFDAAAQGSSIDGLTAAGWEFTPNVFARSLDSECLIAGDCVQLGRSSPNGMLDAAHAIAPGTHEFAVAWGGAGCELLVENGDPAETQRFDGIPFVEGEVLPVTVGTVSAAAGARIVLCAAESQSCRAAYVLLKESAVTSAPPSPPSLPPSPVEDLSFVASHACVDAINCTTLIDALVLARSAPAGAKVAIELSHGVHDTSDPALWPFDLGRTRAALELHAGAGSSPILDAAGRTTIFIMPLPQNVLTLRGLVLRNGNATRWPQNGAAILVAGGELNLEDCRFEGNRALGSGGAVALMDGSLRAKHTSFDGNTAGGGGGAIAVLETAGLDVSVNLTRCNLSRNAGATSGGAAWLMAGMSHFTSCTFVGDRASANGGALEVAGRASFSVAGGLFSSNRAGGHGAAINFDPTSIDSTATLGGAVFENNDGLSTVKAAQFADWLCRAGHFAPRIGAFEGSWEGCPERCGPGTRAAGDYCESCPPGSFQPGEGSVDCLPCSRGSYCTLGSTAALPCASGRFGNATDLGAAGDCLPCSRGSFCTTGSVKPALCSPGTLTAQESRSECSPCTSGSFQPSAGMSSCLDCFPGSYCIERSTTPIPCSPGHFSSVRGQAQCTACSPGSFMPTANATSCTLCEMGSWCGAGVSSVTLCDVGSYRSSLGAATPSDCQPCPRGSACVRGATTPTTCPAGSHSPAEGAGECLPCVAGRFQNTTGAAACRKCSRGAVCPARATLELAPICSAGTYADTLDESGNPSCFRCEAGYHCLGSGMPPIACPRASYAQNGSNFCTDCATHMTHATTLNAKSGSEDDCACDSQFYLDVDTAGRRTCNACDEESSDCSVPGITLESIPLRTGYWRVAEWSVQLRRCSFPGCAGGTVCRTANGSTTCAADNLCESTHHGPLCQVCTQGYPNRCLIRTPVPMPTPHPILRRTAGTTSRPRRARALIESGLVMRKFTSRAPRLTLTGLAFCSGASRARVSAAGFRIPSAAASSSPSSLRSRSCIDADSENGRKRCSHQSSARRRARRGAGSQRASLGSSGRSCGSSSRRASATRRKSSSRSVIDVTRTRDTSIVALISDSTLPVLQIKWSGTWASFSTFLIHRCHQARVEPAISCPRAPSLLLTETDSSHLAPGI